MSYGPLVDAERYRLAVPRSTAPHRSSHRRSNPDGIDGILQDKVDSLADILSDINRRIRERYQISDHVVDLIGRHYRYIKTKLFEMNQWPVNGTKAIELRRSGLEGTLDTLLNEQRREQVQCWQDVADLRRELWKWFKEYSDVMQRVRLVLSDENSIRLQMIERDNEPADL